MKYIDDLELTDLEMEVLYRCLQAPVGNVIKREIKDFYEDDYPGDSAVMDAWDSVSEKIEDFI